MSNTTIVAGKDGCEMCGARKELRPYGPNGEWICFSCGMKDEPATELAFSKALSQTTIIDARDVNSIPSIIKVE